MNAVLSFLLDVLMSWVAVVLGAVALLACILASVPTYELEEDEHDRHHR